MATFRKRLGRWQSIVRVKGYPARTQSFDSKSDAKLWSSNIKLELHREEHGLRKNKYPTFRECFEMRPFTCPFYGLNLVTLVTQDS